MLDELAKLLALLLAPLPKELAELIVWAINFWGVVVVTLLVGVLLLAAVVVPIGVVAGIVLAVRDLVNDLRQLARGKNDQGLRTDLQSPPEGKDTTP